MRRRIEVDVAKSVADLRHLRVEGQTAAEVRKVLDNAPTKGFWIHVDADVLAAKIMPAVDSPNPRGITFVQLKDILATLLASPKAVGLEITIFDPDLDPDGKLATQLASTIERAFAESGRFAKRKP